MYVRPPALRSNCALTVVLALMLKEHPPVPEQALPLQPAKVLPAAGVAVSVTMEPGGSDSVHVLPQLSEPPDLITVPDPLPTLAIESSPTGVAVKFAMTLL